MFIRNRDEAMNALADIVALPERRDQIIQSTVAIMQCLEPEARRFMADCQAMLIEDGLEGLKRKRQTVMRELRDTEIIAIEDEAENLELDAMATAVDALRFSSVVTEVFPTLSFQPWEIARAMIAQEADLQQQILVGLKARNGTASAEDAAAAAKKVEAIVAKHLPAWRSRAESIQRAVRDVLKQSDPEADPDPVFVAIATSDERATSFLETMDRNIQAAIETVLRLAEFASALRKIEQAQK